ncbi:MAG: NADH:ubiquinone reductase (Na(+)-transporting) subunit A, partial [Duncaniella sp.]|nr:NADH:ubiquinone reductase (Na(+)-transporting) subunit A [Duncaniella sp.]
MRRTINLKKGLNLSLAGGLSSTEVKTDIYPSRIAVIPDDFPGFTPKLDVAEGETVGIGQPIMHDKTDTDITIVSPVEGTVESIVRGPRRKIERVVIKTGSSDVLPIAYPTPTTPAETRHILKRAGLWAMLRQRPYDIVPTGDSVPRDIFVTAMD